MIIADLGKKRNYSVVPLEYDNIKCRRGWSILASFVGVVYGNLLKEIIIVYLGKIEE